MTDKQRRFADTYLRSGDEALALAEAGYAPPWTAERVLAQERVRRYLIERLVADETEVAAFFSAVMRGAPAADDRPPGVKDQLRAAEFLGKHFGMFTPGDGAEPAGTPEFTGDELLED